MSGQELSDWIVEAIRKEKEEEAADFLRWVRDAQEIGKRRRQRAKSQEKGKDSS